MGVGEDDADDRDDRHDGQGEAEDPRGQAFGLPVVATPEQVDEGGDEHGRERTGGDELEEDVRDRARRLVGVAQVGGAEDGGDHPDLHEADAAGRERGDAHPRRGPRRSIFARHHQRASLRGRRAFSGGEQAHWRRSPTRPPSTLLGGRDVWRRVGAHLLMVRPRHRGSTATAASPSPQRLARVCGHARRPPGRRDARCSTNAARSPATKRSRSPRLPLDELPVLIALAHRVRLAYCGPEVELESLINAKSGACPEDCAFCSQSARYSHRRRRLPVPRPRRGARRGARHPRRRRHPVLHRRRGPRARGAAARAR